jgi:ATP phosphoribosyltransferase regulatory subunit HisZ
VSTIHPTPSGTRDVLPDEMREMHAIAEAVRGVFDAHGYGEVHTPALEYEQVLTRGDPAAADPAYKLFDEQGNVLVLRSDMTIPIARVVSMRYAAASPPLRFCYVAHAYRSVRPQRGQDREMLQAGIELVGVPAPEGTAETIAVLCEVLDAVGLSGYRVGLGDASLYPALLAAHGVAAGARARILRELQARDLVGLEREIERLGLDRALLRVPQLRGGPEVLEAAGPAADGLRAVMALLPARARERVIFDLGLTRALGAPLGGGGRYDELLGRFGRDLPAAGWALNVERLHIALVGERRGERL